jgi:predicted  nucleic acid-binding Zn-ribbon protein
MEVEMSYNRCTCQKCGKQYATVIDSEVLLQQEACPNCGEKELKLAGPLSASEVNSLFYSGG